jgi:hypothetical protein
MARQRRNNQSPPPPRAKRRFPWVAIVASAVLLAAVGLIDYATGWEMSFWFFYLVPVVVATWFAGRRAGLAFCVGCAAVCLGSELASGPALWAVLWNTAAALGVFLTVCFLLGRLRAQGLSFPVPAFTPRRRWLLIVASACLLVAGTAWACWHWTWGGAASGRRATDALAKLAADLEACKHLSRAVLLGSRDPSGPSCVQVVKTGQVQGTVPGNMGDLDGGPGTTLALLYLGPAPRARSAREDFAWHQGRLKTWLENLQASNDEPLRLATELSQGAQALCDRLQARDDWPGGFSPTRFAEKDDWPSFCLACLNEAVAARDPKAARRWAAEFASVAFGLADLHRWLGLLAENYRTALEFQAKCQSLFDWAEERIADYDPRVNISGFPAGLMGLHGQNNFTEVERQAERLFQVPRDRLEEILSGRHLTPGSAWMPPLLREVFLRLGERLSPANRRTWEQAARTPYDHSYLLNMLYRASRGDMLEPLGVVLERFSANHPQATQGELMGVLMYRGHSFAGAEWADRFQPPLMEAAERLSGTDLEAFRGAQTSTYAFYRLANYSVTLTLREAIEQKRMDCVRATDMLCDVYRNSGRAGLGHVRWSAGTTAHSVAAVMTEQDGRPRTLMLDGMSPAEQPEVWPEAYFRGHPWPPGLEANPPPYAVELYVRGLDNYVWAEGYVIRDASAGTLMKAAVPYLAGREKTTSQKVFGEGRSQGAGFTVGR